MPFGLVEHIRRHGFKRLLLAVSGGLDSICLAHYFVHNKEILGIEWLGIAHVHHGLREETADREAAFVEAFARKYNVPFFLKKLDGKALKNAEGSLEENARDARYKALADVSLEALRADKVHHALDPSASPQDDEGLSPIVRNPIAIVTAHHAGDQAETMYMRLRRGTTLAGLRGIQAIRPMSNVTLEALRADRVHYALDPITSAQDDTSSICIYRPFLNMTHGEFLAYARENGLEWCEDESNADVKFARNRVRHDLLPQLEQECPGAREQLCRIAGVADRAYAKVIARCEALFAGIREERVIHDRVGDDTHTLTLDKKRLNKVLREHASADLSEMLRLWLSERGFRFPIGFFYGTNEPAHVKIPHHAAYRRRSIAKIGPTVWICEFKSPEEAQKFVSCGMKEKGL